MGRTTFLQLCTVIVTTNVDVLCEYLPQEFPLWGTIKGYCIVLLHIELFLLNNRHTQLINN